MKKKTPLLERTSAKQEERAQSILAAAFGIFVRQGFAAARMDEIAKQAGVTKGLIYFYFPSKEELFQSVVRTYIIAKLHKVVLNLNPEISMARNLVHAMRLVHFILISNPLLLGFLRLLLTEGHRFEDFRKFHYEEAIAPVLVFLKHILTEGARRGEWEQERITEHVQIIMAPMLIYGVWNMIFVTVAPINGKAYLKEHVTFIFRALGLEESAISELLETELSELDEQHFVITDFQLEQAPHREGDTA